RLHHHLPQVRLRRLVQFSGISFRLHTRITRKALFGAPVSKTMKPEAFNGLLTAKTLFESAERFCRSTNEHVTTAGVVMLQDAVELFFLACVLEHASDGEDLKLEKAGFPELMGALRARGIKIPRSGTLNAMNKARVVGKHYGQPCAPSAAAGYLEAARAAVETAVRQVFSISLSGIFSASLLKDGVGKSYLLAAQEAFDLGDFGKALVQVRQALFVEFESDYFVGDYRAPIGTVVATSRGYKAPLYARNQEWALSKTDPLELLIIDYERLRFDLLELGISVQEFYNVRSRTPVAVELTSGDWRVGLIDMFAPYEPDREKAEYCIDRTVSFVYKKQSHADSLSFDFGPPGKRYETRIARSVSYRRVASHKTPIEGWLTEGTTVLYLGTTNPFEQGGDPFAKVFLSLHPGAPGVTYYIESNAITRTLVDLVAPIPYFTSEAPPVNAPAPDAEHGNNL
ncbi:hypothetical protein ACTJLC_21905, partial [Paraburkholderia sp. 22099]|uniref:hypothetical protein n=1 Tax=Paraburkholderia sp. 22099 TaxID=3453875 RepID=UPI003F852B82